jgi:quinol monooxygenase YgiN
MNGYVQIVTFKLKPASSRQLFVELTEQMVAWLKGQTGFIAYELYEGNHCWSARIVWQSEANARSGLAAFLATDVANKMRALVECDYQSFFGEAVVIQE